MLLFAAENILIPIDPASFGNLVLKGLHEISLPETVSYMPTTIGWKVLALAVLSYGLYRFYRGLCFWHKNRYRRVALAAVGHIKQQNLPPQQAIQKLAVLLKASALQAYPRVLVAPLVGADWLAFLNQQTVQNYFDETAGYFLLEGQYGAVSEKLNAHTCEQFTQQIEQWLLAHRGLSAGESNA